MRRNRRRNLRLEQFEGRRLLAQLLELPEAPSTVEAPAIALSEHVHVDSSHDHSSGNDDSHSDHLGRFAPTHHEPFLPNFAGLGEAVGRHVSASTDDGAWHAQFPTHSPNHVVVVRDEITLRSDIDVHTIVIEEGGVLRIPADASLTARVVHLQVLEGGTLEIGTENAPVIGKVEVIFKDVAIDLTNDPGQYGNGLIVQGTIRIHGRPIENTSVRVGGDLASGQTDFSTASRVDDWAVGDEVLIPDTRQIFYTDSVTETLDHYERVVVSGTDGAGFVAASPLQFEHKGAHDAAGTARFAPHVANLTRTVVFRSENPLGTRAHTIFMGRANVDIRFAAFNDLGRTTNDPLDDTLFADDGTAIHVGTNQAARYPVHFHHLIGPVSAQSNGHQFTFTGNAIDNAIDGPSPKWGLVVHGSHYGLVADNVIFNTSGAGIVTEDGTETGNLIKGNFISRITGTRDRGKFSDGREGSGIWMRRPNNHFEDNVVTGAEKSAYAIYGGDNTLNPPVKTPSHQGANPHMGQYTEVSPDTMHLLTFSNNEAYASHMGIELWYLGFETYYNPSPSLVAESRITESNLWNINHTGIFGEQANNVVIERLSLIGSRDAHGFYNYPTGVKLNRAVDTVIRDFAIENFRIGVTSPIRTERLDPNLTLDQVDPFTLVDGRLRNGINFQAKTPAEDAIAAAAPRNMLVENVSFERGGFDSVETTHVQMQYAAGHFRNVAQLDVVTFVRFNNVTGNDFRVYYNEQAPDYVLPMTGELGGTALGAPESGLTNTQSWSKYGVAIGGAVAPLDPHDNLPLSIPGVLGMAFPLYPEGLTSRITRIDEISVDQGYTSNNGRPLLQGVAEYDSDVDILVDGNWVATVRSGSDARWSYQWDHAPLADGTYTIATGLSGSGRTDSTTRLTIRDTAPTLHSSHISLGQNAVAGEFVTRVAATDPDPDDRLTYELLNDPSDAFAIDPLTGDLTVAVAGRFDFRLRPTISLQVRVTDSTGYVDTGSILISIAPPQPSEWVPLLDYTEFSMLTPEVVQYLTPAQIESIPNPYWFAKVSIEARAALSAEQVGRLSLQEPGMIGNLLPEQREHLSPSQVRTLHYSDIWRLPASKVPLLTTQQVASIPFAFWLSRMTEEARLAFTLEQISHLRISDAGTIGYLSAEQREFLTGNQIRSLSYVDFWALSPTLVTHLSGEQIASIPNEHFFSRLSLATRAALSVSQVHLLDLSDIGTIGLLTQQQRDALTTEQVRTLRFEDFRWLTPSQALLLTHEQLHSIPSLYWFNRMSNEAIEALTDAGAYWTDGIGVRLS